MMIMANSISTLQTCAWMCTCKGAKKSQAAQRAKNWPEAFGNASLLVWWVGGKRLGRKMPPQNGDIGGGRQLPPMTPF